MNLKKILVLTLVLLAFSLTLGSIYATGTGFTEQGNTLVYKDISINIPDGYTIEENDAMYHARYMQITGTFRGDRHNRHVMIDSSLLGIEGTAKYIEKLVSMVKEA